ncbi:hypothetical protein AX768_04715 [Burkholderia sp. PAMC 28687]|uniref:DUF3892 domain-containing protein n=1 Tax=Burkholderia sp. PAMC 28687 TaxID=1795874 RepID=UPI0007846027|nr:DUF3892 domain-containing protein [Burkholderia sp. PAMC 28687]AMM13506.1 hypothetical protein AX768_04715 [Burkholderia sp. PAMC 28687]
MSQRVEVKCINKFDRLSRHEAIRNIGGINVDGTRWKMSEANAISAIEEGKYSFFVTAGGYTTDVLIWKTQQGHKFLRTGRDATTADNLLSLPECPA